MTLNYDIRRDSHAIGEFSAILKFVTPVGIQTFAKVAPLLEAAAKRLNLPAVMNVQVFNIQFGSPNQTPLPTAGSGFQRFAPNGETACSLWCDQDSIVLTLREYDRWHNVLPLLVETFELIAPGYMLETPAIRMLSVQYLNEFRAKGPEITQTGEIFRKETKWLAPVAHKSDQPWHCHIGQFIPANGAYRYLININCDISPSRAPSEKFARNYVKVLIVSSCQYDLPKGPLIPSKDGLKGILESNFNDAHRMEKQLLNEIISDEYLLIMGKGAREH